ncbi:MAG: phosphatase PAP2 family protein [Pseudomonadota bacterium]|nr:phosphatase PAP2 family protein [Pseudomonadota bacterium]
MITFTAWLRRHAVKLIVLFVGVLLPLYGFGVLAEDVLSKEAFPFDQTLLLFAHAHASVALDRIMIFFTRAGSAVVLVPFNLVMFVVLLMRAERTRAVFWLGATGGAALLNLLAKHTFERIRPSLWVSLLPEHTFSFPSGHAMQSMAVCVALIALAWHSAWRWPAIAGGLIFVLMVSASRVYLGVHYPSDILAGWTASVAWVTGLASVFRIVSRARNSPDTSVT